MCLPKGQSMVTALRCHAKECYVPLCTIIVQPSRVMSMKSPGKVWITCMPALANYYACPAHVIRNTPIESSQMMT